MFEFISSGRNIWNIYSGPDKAVYLPGLVDWLYAPLSLPKQTSAVSLPFLLHPWAQNSTNDKLN